jgi:sulfate/thiosulfate transport system ATP-binding protein
VQALVTRVVHLGFEVRVELKLEDGRECWAQVTREEAEELELAPGSKVFVRPRRTREFSAGEGEERQFASQLEGADRR